MDLFAEELLDLWENPIVHEGVEYKVALIAGIWDGKGYEKVTHTRGGSSHSGCNKCDFHGVTFGKTVVFPFYSRYLNMQDPRRRKRPIGVPNSGFIYYINNYNLSINY